jgi:hypothetical protein
MANMMQLAPGTGGGPVTAAAVSGHNPAMINSPLCLEELVRGQNFDFISNLGTFTDTDHIDSPYLQSIINTNHNDSSKFCSQFADSTRPLTVI